LFTFTFSFAFTVTITFLGLAVALPFAIPLSFEKTSFTVTISVTVTVKGRVAWGPSHEWVWVWGEGGSGGWRRETGSAGANVDAEIGWATGCALAGCHKLCPETRNFLLILLAYFSMLGLEVIETLTNDVEFIDLAGNWIEGIMELREHVEDLIADLWCQTHPAECGDELCPVKGHRTRIWWYRDTRRDEHVKVVGRVLGRVGRLAGGFCAVEEVRDIRGRWERRGGRTDGVNGGGGHGGGWEKRVQRRAPRDDWGRV
jgi:hypothetical protein